MKKTSASKQISEILKTFIQGLNSLEKISSLSFLDFYYLLYSYLNLSFLGLLIGKSLQELSGALPGRGSNHLQGALMAINISIVLVDSDLLTFGDQFLLISHKKQLSTGHLNEGKSTSGSTSTDLMWWYYSERILLTTSQESFLL